MTEYLLQTDGTRTILRREGLEDGYELLETIKADSWMEARAKVPQLAEAPEAPARVWDEPLFKSAHGALIFAHQFVGQQSPKTPMSTMLKGGNIGSGKGLVALDGAGQAGMIMAALEYLTREQKLVLMVRYGDQLKTCQCCGQEAPTAEWREAVDALSLRCEEIKALPKQVRHAAVIKIVCRRKRLLVGQMANEHGLSPRTLRHKMSDLKQRLGKIENSGMAWLEDFFRARGLLPQE